MTQAVGVSSTFHRVEIDPDFESIDRLRTAVTNLSTETFIRLISDHLAFKDDNFQTVMLERNGGGDWGE